MKLSAGGCVYPPMLDTICPATSPEERRGQRQRGQPPAVVPHVKVQMPPRLNFITFYVRLTSEGIG